MADEATTTEVTTGNEESVLTQETTAPAVETTPVEPVKEVAPETTQDPGKGKPEEGVGAPENYEDFTFPEGMEVAPAELEAFLPLAKELDLSQEQAQKLIDLDSARKQQAAEASAQRWEDLKGEWADSARSDQEYGGQNFDENVGLAKKALDQFGTDELKEALVLTGTGSHPEIIRFFYRVGKALDDARMLTGTAQPVAKKPEELMYPSMFKDQ